MGHKYFTVGKGEKITEKRKVEKNNVILDWNCSYQLYIYTIYKFISIPIELIYCIYMCNELIHRIHIYI
jgi:hypothetical protein